MALRKKFYHCEISFQKSSYFIRYSSDTQALITATLAHYFSHLNLTLSIDQRIQIILFCTATCIWQRCSSLSASSHNGLSQLCLSLWQSAELTERCHPQTYSLCRDKRCFTVPGTEFSCKVLNSPGQISVKF